MAWLLHSQTQEVKSCSFLRNCLRSRAPVFRGVFSNLHHRCKSAPSEACKGLLLKSDLKCIDGFFSSVTYRLLSAAPARVAPPYRKRHRRLPPAINVCRAGLEIIAKSGYTRSIGVLIHRSDVNAEESLAQDLGGSGKLVKEVSK